VFLSICSYGQRDTINYWKGQLELAIKDTDCFPIGKSKDSFIITNNPNIDTIFKYFKVTNLIWEYPGYTNHNILDSLYNLFCDCDEYKLMDTLNKYNIQENYTRFYGIQRVARYTRIQTLKPYIAFKFYPNPLTDNLFIINNDHESYNLQIIKNNGQNIYSQNNISESTFLINTSGWDKGIYYILFTSISKRLVNKIIKI
jgi:hypothetical protein